MAATVVLSLNVSGLQGASRSASNLANALQRVHQVQQSINAAGWAGAPAGAAGGGRGGGGGGGGSRQRSFMQRLSSFLSTTRFGMGGASPLVGRTMNLFGMGGGATGAAGTIAVIGVVVALKLAITALRAFAETVAHAQQTVSTFGGDTLMSGGSPMQVAMLRAMGVPAGQVSALAGGLRGRLGGGDPFAIMAASQLGLGFVPGRQFGGPINEAQLMQKAMTGLDRMMSTGHQADALRIVRQLPELQGLLPMLNVSNDVRAGRRGDADATARIMGNPQTVRSANDLGAAFQRMQNMWDLLIASFGTAGFVPIKEGLMDLANAMRITAIYFSKHPELARSLGEVVKLIIEFAAALVLLLPEFSKFVIGFYNGIASGINMVTAMLEGFLGGIRIFVSEAYKMIQALAAMFGKKLPDLLLPPVPNLQIPLIKPMMNAAQKNQDAANDMAKAASDFGYWVREGTFGGGERARGALPGRFSGMAFNERYSGEALKLGAFIV